MNNIDANALKRTLANNLSRLLQSKNMSQTDLAKVLSLPEMTVSNWVNAKTYPRVDKIQLLADYFGVLKSDLTEEHSEQPYYTLNAKDERDIETKMQEIITDLENNALFSKEDQSELSEETRELLRASIENSIRLAKQMAKKKYTPKKYRN